uniref:Uncharacterized protein n=1 Tax=Sinorhizobium meliloti (strain SM11) TaxID=707241 RepID=A4KVG4_SINMM|nr:hypothetical protein [Sinorhizobium meliloti SM11]
MPVIFPERLLTGARPEPAFLVTKPFNAGEGAFFDGHAGAFIGLSWSPPSRRSDISLRRLELIRPL